MVLVTGDSDFFNLLMRMTSVCLMGTIFGEVDEMLAGKTWNELAWLVGRRTFVVALCYMGVKRIE